MVVNGSTAVKHFYQQEQQKKRQSIDNSMIRFPKLDECAHFHYEFAELTNFHVSLIINENCANSGGSRPSANNENSITNIRNLYLFVRVQSLNRSWTVRRNLQDFRFLDIQLHKCVFDRKHSKLKPLNLAYFSSFDSLDSIIHFIAQYLERLSQIVGGCFLTCGPVLHWFEIDNRGNRLINEESDINTPAIGAAFVIKKHNKSDVETEISLEIGELISVIEMPPVNESFYWKGKKGFEVGFFPAECVQLIDDKISRKTEELPLRPLSKCTSPTLLHRASDPTSTTSFGEELHSTLGSHSTYNQHYHQSVMRKHGLIAALFRTFASGGGRRRDQLKQSGILKERVFGCDLCEHLANSGHELPLVLTTCCAFIETHGLSANGIYRLSGVASTINRLRNVFDEDRIPSELIDQHSEDIMCTDVMMDIHAVSSLLKLYFRELPNPLLTFSLYESFVAAMRDDSIDEATRLQAIRSLVISLPPPHWRTLRFLTRHLSFVSKFELKTGMTPKNLAIVWAPNLLRSRDLDQHVGLEALHVIGTQAVLTEFLILNCDKIFDREEHEIHPPKPLYSPFTYPKHVGHGHISSKGLKYIDVGPEIIPGKYHTIIAAIPTTQGKRSKFNIHNWKKFHFFSTRSHNGHHRPSIFGDENVPPNGQATFRQLNVPFDDHSTSESTNNFSPYLKPMNGSLSPESESKSVKRAQSFDSYFKKLRTSGSCNNKVCEKDMNDADGNHTMVDINRNKCDHMNKNGTIFEVEEMSIDCEGLLGEMSKLHPDLIKHERIEMNGNKLPQIDEEPSKIDAIPQDTAGINQSNYIQQMDTNYNCSSAPSGVESHCAQLSTIPRATNSMINELIDDNQCSHNESKSNEKIPPAKSLPQHTSCSSNEPHKTSSTNPIDTHSPYSIETLSTSSSNIGDEGRAALRKEFAESNSEGKSTETITATTTPALSDYPIMDEPNSSSQHSSSTHSSLNSVVINEPNLQSPEPHSRSSADLMDSGNVQSSDNSDSSSPTIAHSSAVTTPIATTLTNSSSVAITAVHEDATAPPAVDDHTARERIERIKEERRNQIRQNFALKDPINRRSPSRIPIAFRSGTNLPDVVNSSENSPVKLRNKPPTGTAHNRMAWRNSEISVKDSFEPLSTSSSSPCRKNISDYRRSVPNLELQFPPTNGRFDSKSPSSKSSTPSPRGSLIERTSSVNNSATPSTVVKYRRPKMLATSISVEEEGNSGGRNAATSVNRASLPPPRSKIAVTPLRTITKRQRIIDPKTLAQMFEQQHSSADNI